jgi:hypothetical protein
VRRKLLGLLGTAVLAATGFAVAPASPAAAASGCWYNNGNWWCRNTYGARVYSLLYDGTYSEVGRMYTTTSWFDCRDETIPAWVGGPHPYRWEFTKADNGAWGWMKDTSIISETDPLPICVED